MVNLTLFSIPIIFGYKLSFIVCGIFRKINLDYKPKIHNEPLDNQVFKVKGNS